MKWEQKNSYIQSPMEARHSSNQAMLFITFFFKKNGAFNSWGGVQSPISSRKTLNFCREMLGTSCSCIDCFDIILLIFQIIFRRKMKKVGEMGLDLGLG